MKPSNFFLDITEEQFNENQRRQTEYRKHLESQITESTQRKAQ